MEQLAKNLESARAAKGVTIKWILEKSALSEKTVSRLFKGKAKNPSTDTLKKLADVLDVSTDFLLHGAKLVIGTEELAVLQERNDRLTAELAKLMDKLVALETELSAQKDTIAALTAENDMLRLKLEHKEEIIAIHNYYINKERKN